MSSTSGPWTFHTRRYRVEYREYGDPLAQIRLALVYRKANDVIPIGSASSFPFSLGPTATRKQLLTHALNRASDRLLDEWFREKGFRA